MDIRALSGILFLVASIITLPLVLLPITLIIPIFFFITAIMMFARRSKVGTVPTYGPTYDYPPYYNQRDDYNDRHYYEEEPTQYNDKEEYIESPRKTEKSEHRIRRKPSSDYGERKHDYGDYHHIIQNNDEQGFSDDIKEDKYNQYPKRAVKSEYQQSSNDGTPGVPSRQRKYEYKSKNSMPNEVSDDENNVEKDLYISKKEQKAQRKREKAELRVKKKEKRKAYNQRMKEKRKSQPNAVNQRRMNYEERRQILDKEENKEKHSVDQE